MYNKIFVISLVFILLFGCITPEEEDTPLPQKEYGDIELVSIELLNETPIFLGDKFKVRFNTTSTSLDDTYFLSVKLGEDKIQSHKMKGNQSYETEIYAHKNGNLNLTGYVYLSTDSKMNEKSYDNNELNILFKIHSYGVYNFSSKNTSYSVISNEKIHSVKLHFEEATYINSIGSFVRVTAPLNVDSYFIYEIVNDDNGLPGNESIYNLTTQLYNIGANWDFLLLQKKEIKLEPGTYWLNMYTDKKNFLNVACYDVSNSTDSFIGTNYVGEYIKWNNADCIPYFIVSSSSLIDTGYDFENRFTIFPVALFNSS